MCLLHALPPWRHLTRIKEEEGNPCFSHTDHNNLRLVPCPRAPAVAACFSCRRCYYVAFGRLTSEHFTPVLLVCVCSCERGGFCPHIARLLTNTRPVCLSTVLTPRKNFSYGRATGVQPWPFIVHHVATCRRIIFTSGASLRPHPTSDTVWFFRTARGFVCVCLFVFKGTEVVFRARTARNTNTWGPNRAVRRPVLAWGLIQARMCPIPVPQPPPGTGARAPRRFGSTPETSSRSEREDGTQRGARDPTRFSSPLS